MSLESIRGDEDTTINDWDGPNHPANDGSPLRWPGDVTTPAILMGQTGVAAQTELGSVSPEAQAGDTVGPAPAA